MTTQVLGKAFTQGPVLGQVMVLGRRFSLAPVLNLQFASPSWARKGKQSTQSTGDYEEYLRRAAKLPPRESGNTYGVAEDKPPAPVAPPPVAPEEESLDAHVLPEEAESGENSDIYERTANGTDHRELTPKEKGDIDSWVLRNVNRRGTTKYVNPMAVALDVDAPVHRIAHHLESKHGLLTVPPEPGEGTAGDAATRHLSKDQYQSWLDDWALRQAAHDKRFRFPRPKAADQKEGESDEDHALRMIAGDKRHRIPGARADAPEKGRAGKLPADILPAGSAEESAEERALRQMADDKRYRIPGTRAGNVETGAGGRLPKDIKPVETPEDEAARHREESLRQEKEHEERLKQGAQVGSRLRGWAP